MKLDSLYEKLRSVKSKKERADSIRTKIKQVEEQIEELNVKLEGLKSSMDKEKRDVEKLNGISLSKLWLSITGGAEEKLDKEEQEYAEERFRYENALKQMDEVKREKEKLVLELKVMGNVDAEYEEILRGREEMLRRENSQYREKLLELIEREETLKNAQKEISEAITAGGQAIDAIAGLIERLDTAAGWGVVDLIGGGFLSTAIKHSELDRAEEAALQAQNSLNRLKSELADVGRYADLGVHLSGLATFADYFFDSLFVDWAIQSRIDEAKRRAQEQKAKVEGLIADLRGKLTSITHEIEKAEEERRRILEE